MKVETKWALITGTNTSLKRLLVRKFQLFDRGKNITVWKQLMSDFKVEMEKISTFPRIITLWVFPSQSLIAKNRLSRRWGLKYEIIKNILKKLHALFIWTLSFFMICWKIVCRQFRKQTDRPHNKQSPRLGRRAKSYKGDLELDNWKSQNYFHWFLHGNKPTMHVIRIS